MYITRVERLSFSIYKSVPKKIFTDVEFKYFEPFLEDIRKVNKIRFIAFQYSWLPTRYAGNLLRYFPELLADLSDDDLVKICTIINRPLCISDFLNFSGRYLEVDCMSIFNQANLLENVRKLASDDLLRRGPIVYDGNDKFSMEIRKLRQK